MLHGGDADGAVPILGGENHAFADKAILELTRCKVGNEEHLFADELLRFVPLTDAADDSALVESVLDEELEELLHLWHALTLKDSSHADVELLEVVVTNGFLDRICLCVGSEVCLASCFQFVELELDDIVFNLFEKKRWLGKLLASRKQFCAAEVFPTERFHIDHLAEFLRREWEEWLEGDGEVGSELERDVDDGLHALWVGLDDFPRLFVGNVLVANACQIHGFLLCIAELEVVEQLLHVLLHILELVECCLVGIAE